MLTERGSTTTRTALVVGSGGWPQVRWIRPHLGGEIKRLLVPHPRSRPSSPACKIALIAALGCFAMQRAAAGHPGFVERVSAIRGYEPLPVVFERLPLSLIAPTTHLPAWGAIAQVLIVFWLAERHLGVPRTLALIVVFHTTATLAGRWMIELGPHAWFHLGVPHSVAFVRDTGPSAAVVGLCVYLGCTARAPVLAGLIAACMIGELLWKPDLAGREHLVAMVVALVVAAPVLATRWRDARSDSLQEELT